MRLVSGSDMKIDYDKMAEVFDATRSQDPRLLDSVALGISAIAGEGEKVLDIGTGTGRFLVPLTKLGIDACGFDISKNMLLKARAKKLTKLVQGDAVRLPFSDRAFKASLVTNVLHLVHGWKDLMMEASRVSDRAVIAVDLGRGGENPMEVFKSIMTEKGFAPPRAGPLESELAKCCAPECRIMLGRYEERTTKKEILSNLSVKTFTFQSELTDDQNRQCMEEFGSRYADEIVIPQTVTLIVWNPARLRERIPDITFSYPHSTTF
jgi:ubiquinone/menaquinone biosynthesis C-methylase UbiE